MTELIHFFTTNECENYNSGSFYIRDYDADGNYSTGIVSRLIRRTVDTRFVGKIHEQLNEWHLPHKQFSCFLHHYGYAFQTLEEAQKHQERNVSILKKEFASTGHHPHLSAQLTQELIYLETSTEDGFRFAQEAISLFEKTNQMQDSFSQWLLYATVLYHLRKNNPEDAKQRISEIQERYQLSEFTQLVFSGVQANLALQEKNVPDMLSHASHYLQLWDWLKTHPSEYSHQVSFNYPHFFAENYYYSMVHIAAAAANALKQYRMAKQYWNCLPLDSNKFDSKPYYSDIEATITGLKQVHLLQQKQADLEQHFVLLLQAVTETVCFIQAKNISVASEYLEVIRQFAATLHTTLVQTLGEDSHTCSHLADYLQKVAAYQNTLVSNNLDSDKANFNLQERTHEIYEMFLEESAEIISKNL